MVISELQEALNDLKQKHGDIQVCFMSTNYEGLGVIDSVVVESYPEEASIIVLKMER